MKSLTLLPILFVSLGLTSIAPAQETSESHKAAAAELIGMLAPKETFVAAFMAGVEPLFDQLKSSGIDAAKIEEVKAASVDLAEKVANDPEMTEQLTAIYITEFTEAEIGALLEFYRTPIGAKALSKLPQLTQKGAEVGRTITEKHQGAFQAKIQEILGGN
jgi:hypothetical protein